MTRSHTRKTGKPKAKKVIDMTDLELRQEFQYLWDKLDEADQDWSKPVVAARIFFALLDCAMEIGWRGLTWEGRYERD